MDLDKIIQEVAILAPPFLLALTVHEYAHGLVAWKLGDPTARQQGRLSLNPLRHLDPLGVLAFIIMKIGWAKPVPVDPRYFQNPRQGMVWVSLAGVGANLLLALLSGLALHLLRPLAGILPQALFLPFLQMLAASVWINIMLTVFNLIPIPPLDGSRVLLNLLPGNLARIYGKLDPLGFVLLLVLFYTGVIPRIMYPIISFARGLILG